MPGPNQGLTGGILPGDIDAGTEPGIDTTQVIDGILAALHAASRAELVFWTEAELIHAMDEALKRLARKTRLWVTRDATTVTAAATPDYALPQRHIQTLHVTYDGTPLRPASVAELVTRDGAFRSTGGTPTHWYEDQLGGATIGLAKVPAAIKELDVIYAGWPEPLDAGRQQTMVLAPAPLKGYLAVCVLAEAWGQEGEGEMPEAAAHCRERIAMYDQLFASYWGTL
jgi:hypothetical protein